MCLSFSLGVLIVCTVLSFRDTIIEHFCPKTRHVVCAIGQIARHVIGYLIGMTTDHVTYTLYLLPDGFIVPVDSTVAKGELFVTFQLKGGSIVEATRLDATSLGRAIYSPSC